jgi:hypothetical protein
VLTPLRIVWRDPDGLDSVDSAGAGRCDDDCEYAFKDDRHHAFTPHDEWFCTHLAGAVGIACPPCAVVEDESRKSLFGSRWEGGVAREKWWELVMRGEIELSAVAPTLSRIFAFDHFVFNDDRHLNNYIVRESRNGWIMLAFDFSRAWTHHGFPPNRLPFNADQNTRLAFRYLTSIFGNFIDVEAVNTTMDRLAAFEVARVKDIIARHPKNWLTDSCENAIIDWWASPARLERIEMIRRGISDGSYL